MAVMRINKTGAYTVMSNTHFKEKGMTLKAKGLLSLMLSLPDNWDYSIAGLCAICVEKESAIKSTLNELREFGYLRINKLFPNETDSGRIEYVYDIYETPQNQAVEKQDQEKQGIEILPLENQAVENPRQLNTNIPITKELNTNKQSTYKAQSRFTPPTLEEVRAYCEERGNNVDAERFIDYYTANGWKVGKNPMKDWKATVRNWERTSTQSKTAQNGKQEPSFIDDMQRLYDKYKAEEEENGNT